MSSAPGRSSRRNNDDEDDVSAISPKLIVPGIAVLVLGLPRTTRKREARLGQLRVSRRAGWLWTTGRWAKEWLEAGERKRKARPDVQAEVDR